ncbi:pentatricopeptide repeat-containing protein At2g37230-like [Lotus japonicus]|uniref:pentatricopeptide repeat-containing protein At2g37230-like n=1 Tax=Lotus japonicus TaxID=34305 RepID=UPI0025904EDB|nr:pentatricopeptide repeat-containing protein At2g37230-like [Lotus japonicus]
MSEKGVAPDCLSFKANLQGLCKDKRETESEELLKEMNGKGLATDNNMIVLAHCYVGIVEEALEILRDMAEKGVEPDCFSFKAVLQGLCKYKRKIEAEELLKEMNGKGLATGDNMTVLAQ